MPLVLIWEECGQSSAASCETGGVHRYMRTCSVGQSHESKCALCVAYLSELSSCICKADSKVVQEIVTRVCI